MIQVFISYSHDSNQYEQEILAFVEKLRNDGINTIIDESINGTPKEGWIKWMRKQILESDFVIMMFTPTYKKRFYGEDKKGKGATFETKIISQLIYNDFQNNIKFIPVILDNGNTNDIVIELQDSTYYRINRDYVKLYRYLTTQPKYIPSKVGKIKKLPPISTTKTNMKSIFSDLIKDRTQLFVGRKFIFDKFSSFLEKERNGYFLILADPGFGKSSLSAKLIKSHNYIHYFINYLGTDTKEKIIEYLISQIKERYPSEKYETIREYNEDDFFKTLKIAKEETNNKIVLVIDGLDELNESERNINKTFYFLPKELPSNTYIFITSRRDKELFLPIKTQKLEISNTHKENINDCQDFIKGQINNTGIKMFIKSNSINEDIFIKMLLEKSEYNMMYLFHILKDITNFDKIEGIKRIEEIPQGIENYFTRHWRKMKKLYTVDWFKIKLPVLVKLTLSNLPVSLDEINEYTNIERKEIRLVINEWIQFIHIITSDVSRFGKEQYKLYHTEFRNFIYKMDEIEEERIDLEKNRKVMALHKYKLFMNNKND